MYPPLSLETEYQALIEAAGIADLKTESEVYELTGEDRKKFLNAYVTQDIQSMAAWAVRPGAFLTQKGKMVSDVLILNLPEKFLLLFPKGYGEKVKQHLTTFLMFSNSKLEPANSAWGHFVVLGPYALEILHLTLKQSISEKISEIQSLECLGKPLLLWLSQHWGIPGYEILLPQETAQSFSKLLLEQGKTKGLISVENEVLEVLRVEAGIPKMGVDMSEANLVAEVGLDETATSFNKGCYLGQETTARVHSMGHVNKKLTLLKFPFPVGAGLALPAPGVALPADIFQGEKLVGHLTSLVYSFKWKQHLGLGIIERQAAEGGSTLFVRDAEGKVEIEKVL